MSMEQITEQLVPFVTTYGLKIIGAILILIVGRIAAGLLRGGIRKLLVKAKTDPAIVGFVGTLVYLLVIAFTIIAALSKFGVETASFVAILGAAGFAVGFALQGSLANFAAGVLILVFRPYRVGDYIEAGGVAGTVKDVRLFNTVLATPDNVKILVPNGKINGDIIKNYTAFDTRRVDFVFGIAYGASIQAATDTILSVMKGDGRVLGDPVPMVAVTELADSSVNLVSRCWAKKEDYWDVRFDVMRKVKEELDLAGIEIPFPQTVVHMAKEAGVS